MSHALFRGYHRIHQNRKIRPGDRIHIQSGSGCCKMPSGRETHDANFVHAPLLRIMAAVTECVLHISQRHVPMPVRQTIIQHGCAYPMVIKPLRCHFPFRDACSESIASARGNDDHLSVRILSEIEIETDTIPREGVMLIPWIDFFRLI